MIFRVDLPSGVPIYADQRSFLVRADDAAEALTVVQAAAQPGQSAAIATLQPVRVDEGDAAIIAAGTLS